MQRLLRVFFILLAASFLFTQSLRGEENLASYIQEGKNNLFSRESQPSILNIGETTFLSILDLFLSCACLWLTMLILFRRMNFNLKAYLWFIFAYNFCWFMVLMFSKGAWKALNFLVISQDASLETIILDKFCTAIAAAAVIIFIWLLARSFSLQLLGALEAFFTLHLIYLAIILVFSLTSVNFSNQLIRLARENLGLRSIIRSYFSEINKAFYGSNFILLEKIKVYHL